jgi:Clostripain family
MSRTPMTPTPTTPTTMMPTSLLARRCRRLVLAAAAALALGIAAATPALVEPAATVAAQTTAGWHLLVYTVNDSEADLPLGLDLDEMVAASRSGIAFTVYVDGSSASSPTFASSAVPRVDEAVIVEIAGGTATITQHLGEVDSGSPDTLGWFVAQGLRAHPTERIGLVIWDHGSGWQGIAFDQDVSSAGAQRRTSSIAADELGAAMAAARSATGHRPLDLVIFDACLMANWDVLAATAPSADYAIASEELVPGLGLDYDAFTVFTDPDADITTIFDTLASGFQRDVVVGDPRSADAMTLDLVDLAQIAAVDGALTAFTNAAAADVSANPVPYIGAAGAGLRYGTDGDYWAGFLDLGEFLGRLDTISPDVAAARDRLVAAIDGAVIDSFATPTYAASTGLTVYFPTEPREYDANYDAQPTAQTWRPFLRAFYDAQAQQVLATDAAFTAARYEISSPDADGYFTISAPVSAQFAGSVELFAAVPGSAGALTYFETDSGEMVGGRATARILPTLTTISDGINSGVPFTRYVREADGWHGYSQFTLQRSDGSIANMNWDRSEQDTGPITILDPAGTLVTYTPAAGDVAYPVNMVQAPGEQPERVATAPALDPGVPWTVSDQPLAQGTPVYVELQLRDATGATIDSLSGYLVAGK